MVKEYRQLTEKSNKVNFMVDMKYGKSGENEEMNLKFNSEQGRKIHRNQNLNEKYNNCIFVFDMFISSTENILLEENRTIKNLRECKISALEARCSLKQFINELEYQAGNIDFPLS